MGRTVAVINTSVSVTGNVAVTPPHLSSATDSVAVAGTVGVNQGTPTTHSNAWEVSDYYTTLETLADQTGSGTVLTFTFTSTPKLIVVLSKGAVSRAQVGAGTPSATNGVYCDDGVPSYVPVQNQTVKVYAPGGAAVSVWGLS